MKKWFLLMIGWLATGLGFLGLVLPILPTVPFILLAMICFSKSSPRFQVWLQQNRYLGATVTRIKQKEGLTLKEKQKILLYSWLSILLTIIFILESIELRMLLTSVLLVETWVIVRYKTFKPASILSNSR